MAWVIAEVIIRGGERSCHVPSSHVVKCELTYTSAILAARIATSTP